MINRSYPCGGYLHSVSLRLTKDTIDYTAAVLSIGEMSLRERPIFYCWGISQTHHVNKRTLHYYDETGLFQPNRKGENEYRYYSYQQSPEFEMILAFRELGMSIEEIKAYYAERTPENFRRILQDKQHSIHEQIRHLRKIRQMLKVKEAQLNLCEQADF